LAFSREPEHLSSAELRIKTNVICNAPVPKSPAGLVWRKELILPFIVYHNSFKLLANMMTVNLIHRQPPTKEKD